MLPMRRSGTGDPFAPTKCQRIFRKTSSPAIDSERAVNQRAKRTMVFASSLREPTSVRERT